MKNSFVVILFLTALVFGCHKSSTDPGTPIVQIGTYPAGVGSLWSYQETMRSENFRPSYPGATYTPDTLQGTASVTVTRYVRLPSGSGLPGDSIQTSEFQSRELMSGPLPSVALVGYNYYSSDTSGLLLHGYRGNGGMSVPRAVPDARRLVLNGVRFRSMRELADVILLRATRTYADSLQREIPPVKVLKLPLIPGLTWTYRAAGHPWKIEKTVLSDTALNLSGTSYHCFKVHWLYDLDDDGIPDQNISIDDYIAQEGMVLRTMFFKDITISTSENPDGIGMVDSWYEYRAASVNVH